MALVGQHVGDGPGRERGVRAGLRDLGEEAQELGVALGEAGDGAAGEESVAQVTNGTLDFALLQGSQLHVVRQVGRSPSRSPTPSIRSAAASSRWWTGGARGERTASTSTMTWAS